MSNNREYIYADNAATTRLDPAALEAMLPFLQNTFGNASSLYSFGVKSRRAITDARETIAHFIGAEPDEIFFTSGGTESNNWAIKGTANANQEGGQRVITSGIEHASVLKSCQTLRENGWKIDYVPVNNEGVISAECLEGYVEEDTALVSIGLANNEIGTIQNICSLAQTAHKHNTYIHTDAVQAVAHIPIDVKDMGVDSLSASAHKFNGPKGVGFLYVRQNTPIVPLLDGGSQENGLRSGTENTPAIIGMAVALENNMKHLEENVSHISKLTDYFASNLKAVIPDIRFNGSKNRLPGNISISFPGVSAESLIHLLDLRGGICISSGSACKANLTEVSHVLKTIGLDKELLQSTIRISFSKDNTFEEADRMLNVFVEIYNVLSQQIERA